MADPIGSDLPDIEGMEVVRATIAVPKGGDLNYEVGRCLQEVGAMLLSGDQALGGVREGAEFAAIDGQVLELDAIAGAIGAIRKV